MVERRVFGVAITEGEKKKHFKQNPETRKHSKPVTIKMKHPGRLCPPGGDMGAGEGLARKDLVVAVWTCEDPRICALVHGIIRPIVCTHYVRV